MLWEVILLIISVTVLSCYSIGQELLIRYRDLRRADAMGEELNHLPGKTAWEVEKRFGPPTEIVEGTSGRSLYIWKVLSLPHIPKSGGLLVMTLTVSPDGTVTETHWQQRGRS